MLFRLKYKWFVTLLLSLCLVIIGMFALMQWSFDRGFLRYVNRLEQQRLEQLATLLEQHYPLLGDWQMLQTNPALWRQLLRASLVEPESGELLPMAALRRHGPPEDLFARRLVLLDAKGRPVVPAGHRSCAEELRPLQVDGHLIGYLGLACQRKVALQHQLVFASEQKRAFFLIALAMAAGAALLALPLAAAMVRRVQSLAQATHQLAAGCYGVRVEAHANDELGQLARDFNALARTLEQNEQARRRWLADISHELRTPLAVLRGEIEALQDGLRPLDAAALASLQGETLRLGRLVDDLYQLSLSDLGALTYRWQTLDAVALLAQVGDEMRGAFARAGLELCFEWPPDLTAWLRTDGDRLQQLFSNLLANSLAYTDGGGRVRVAAHRDGAELVIDVQDSAPGVPQESLPRLFERLYRVETSRSRERGGAGLGLSICRSIVEAHGGSIQARPSPLGGVWIEVRLPLQEEGR